MRIGLTRIVGLDLVSGLSGVFQDYPCNKCKPTTVAEPFLECKRSQNNKKAREIHGSRETRRTCDAIFEFLRFPRVECLLSLTNAFFSLVTIRNFVERISSSDSKFTVSVLYIVLRIVSRYYSNV